MSEKNPLHVEIGAHVAKWRTARGLSQAQLAERVGYDTSTVGRLECGLRGPSVELLQAISDALEVPLRGLLPGADSEGVAPELLVALKRVEPGDHGLVLALLERLVAKD